MGRKISLLKKLIAFRKKANRHLPIEEMILFGSRAKGKRGKDTDFDLVIVSKKFKKMDFFQRGARMYDYWDLRYPADFLCYTPEEFKKLSKQASIVAEALRDGVKIG